MNRFIIAIAAAAAALTSVSAHAGTLSTEVQFGDVAKNSRGNVEYDIGYSAPLVSFLNYKATAEVTQLNNAGRVGANFVGDVGANLPTFKGVVPSAYAEFGESLNTGRNFAFWGLGVNATRAVTGPVSVSVGYRHREGFTARNLHENRLNAGVGLDIGSGNVVGVNYYRTTGSFRNDQIGVSFSHAF